ncbi:MAG: type I-B CRISPR-associated protein Cas7/Cst2/DevR [Anaerolineae bacterium]
MAFVTGLLLIDAPAAALNMGKGEETTATVKTIRAGTQDYPYVSAQAFRYWLRHTLKTYYPEWQAAPIVTSGKGQKQQAYTEGDPIRYWDDDLLGYMRAVKDETRTRISPFRTSTLVSVMPVQIVEDFGVMARQEDNPVLHSHEFYSTVLQGLFSLNLSQVGTFSTSKRSGFLNLDDSLIEEAQRLGLEYVEVPGSLTGSYRLPLAERVIRVQTLLHALARLEGGAHQTLHYTDVSPAFVIAAVTRGGNHPFHRVVTHQRGQVMINREVLNQVLGVLADDLLSDDIYVGVAGGFMEDAVEAFAEAGIPVMHPREALTELAAVLADHPEWWE